jgi:PKD repeat protein
MKKLILLAFSIALFNISFSQTYSTDFLDGTIMFKLKKEVQVNPNDLNRTNEHSFSLKERISDYPQIAEILADYSVTRFERPSYYTGKTELMKIYRLEFSNFSKIDALVKTLAELDIIEFAEKEPIYKTGFVPNDTFHSGTNKWYHTLVGSEAAWNISQGSNSVKVAIVDNAVFGNHLDLTTFLQRDVSDNDNDATPPQDYNADAGWSHGTHVAGLATADINNNMGIASLGGNVELIGIKATPDNGASGSVYNSYNGVLWACQNGANVVSMSFGSASSSGSFQALINAYPSVVFLAAAGNDNNTILQYPGAYNNVICVGSVDANDGRSFFSNYNGGTQYVDICSPGGYSNGGLLSTVYTTGGNNYAKMGGTSMATPFAAGLVGLMLSINPAMTPAAIEACLISSGVNNGQNMGPRIDALAALQCVQATVNGDPIPAFTGNPTNITEGQSVIFTDNSADGGNPITNWTWSFPNGTPNSFVGQTPPAITYATAGTYDVTLTVTNSQNTVPLTKTNYITVTLVPFGAWIKQNSGFATASRGINHISIVDQNVVWATAYDGSGGGANIQEFTKTTDGGTNWTASNINVGNTALGISMITALDANTAWLAAYPTGGGQTGGIWKTTNGGTNWTRQNSATYSNAASFTNVVHFWNANDGFCQGDPINGEFELYTTTDGGTNWNLVAGANIPNPTNGNEFGYTRQIEVVGDNVWFTTSLGRIYHSTDKGYTWTVYTSPITDFGGAIDANSTGNISYTSATTGLIVDNNSVVYETTNSGANWTQLTTTGTVLTNGLCYIEGTNIAFTTGTGSSYSQDGGTTWNIIDTDQHLYVEFQNASIGWSGWFNQNSTVDGMWKWNNTSGALTADFQGNPGQACVGATVQFTDLSSGTTPTSWNWTFNGGSPATSILQNPTVTYAAPGFYTVSLTVDDGFGPTNKTDSAHIEVVSPTSMPSTITGVVTPCEFDVETYSVTNIPGAVYTWTLPATWTGFSGTNSITATVGFAGGNIEVTADNVCGSSAPRILSVTICPVTGIDEVGNGALSVFPNPAKDVVYINGLMDITSIENKDIKIVDVLGKVVHTTKIRTNNHVVNISNFNKGLYFIILDGGKSTYKFVKE